MTYREIGKTTMLAPLPCALVSVTDGDRTNALTVAWTGIVNTKPPMLTVSVKPERFSHDMLVRAGSFCIHPADTAHIREVDYCGVTSGREHDKLSVTGLTTMVTGKDTPLGIDGFPVCIPCTVQSVTKLGSHDLFLASIEKILVREDLIDAQGAIHLEKAGLVAYSHGLYQELGSVLGFFGFSVAREDVLKRRMQSYASGSKA